MSQIPHIPALRMGRHYDSLNRTEVQDHRSGEVLAAVSSVNAGIVRKDLRKISVSVNALNRYPVDALIDLSAKAGDLFLNGTLPLGEQEQSAQDYITTLSRTSGLPHVMVRRNMDKIHYALTHMSTILNGLSRGLDLSILDSGFGEQFGTRLSFFPTTQALGLVLPSNSPAVNSLWLPAIALKTPVIIKPGREEPWTPYRLIQAFIAAGVPAEAFGFYPTDHEGASTILQQCGRALIFGDRSTTDPYADNPAIQVHGPGWSKILIGDDCIESWRDYLDVMVSAISDNGGRSCINASMVVVPRYGAEIADALAQRLGPIQPSAPDDPKASLSGFANPRMAEFIDGQIEDGLRATGATEATAPYRDGARRVEFEGGTYLRPTVVHCKSFDHPLANREFLCPYASVVEVPQKDMLNRIGYSLAVSAITRDPDFITQLKRLPDVERLNIGPVSTTKISWDQPHEGNLFEFLWQRRSIEQGW